MMNILTSWLSPGLMHAVAWTLLHFLWQGAALAALAAAAMAFCSRASARYAIALIALVMMLGAPVVTLISIRQIQSVTDRASADNWRSGSPVDLTVNRSAGAVDPFTPVVGRNLSSWNSFSWLVEAWLAGVAFSACARLADFFFWSGSAANRPRM